MTGVRDSLRSPRVRWAALVTAIGLLGFGIRFAMFSRSGPLSVGYYDDGVHFAAAVDLVHGRLPYRDVLFLQPPGILLATSPFAALAHLVGDADAFVTARVAFTVIGGLNAALVALILKRFGLIAAVIGGVLYAVSFPAVYGERTVTVEALATTGVLLALLLIPRARTTTGGPWYLLAGMAAGAAIGLKIWYVMPFAVLFVWARGGRLRVLLGGVLACLAIYGPFFVAAPERMFREVVTAQLGRPDVVGISPSIRIGTILGVGGAVDDTPIVGVAPDLVTTVLLVVVAVLVVAALLESRTRVFAVLLAATVAVLLAAPSYYLHYTILCAAPLALIGGVGAQRIIAALPRRAPRVVGVALVVAAVVGLNLRHDQSVIGTSPPVGALRAAADRVHGCVVADDPTLLAVTDLLTPQVEAGCDLQPDPSGAGYVLPYPNGVAVQRIDQPAFQREIVRYLHSGAAWIRIRGPGLGLTDETRDRLDSDPVLFKQERFVLHATPPPGG